MTRLQSRLTPLACLLLPALGCSPNAAPAAEGSAYYSTRSSSTCSAGLGAIGGGSVPTPPGSASPSTGTLVQDGQPLTEAEDNEIFYAVKCKIQGNGPYSISASLEGPNSSPPATNTVTTNISLSGSIAADGTGSGTVDFFTSTTQAMSPTAGSTCTFRATPSPYFVCSGTACSQTEGPNSTVPDYGEAFLEFSCPSMTNGDLGNECEASGTIALQRCALE
jgi:hypothetical protein